jgi:hypothetical protein
MFMNQNEEIVTYYLRKISFSNNNIDIVHVCRMILYSLVPQSEEFDLLVWRRLKSR